MGSRIPENGDHAGTNLFAKGNNTVNFAATVSGRIASLTTDNLSEMAMFVEVVQQPS